MDPKELRKGNLVCEINRSGEVHLPNPQVWQIVTMPFHVVECVKEKEIPAQIKNWHSIKYSDLSPIPLTKQLLERFGAKRNGTDSITWTIGKLEFILLPNGEFIFESGYINIKIDWAHQLQNLHYALTGTELKLKS